MVKQIIVHLHYLYLFYLNHIIILHLSFINYSSLYHAISFHIKIYNLNLSHLYLLVPFYFLYLPSSLQVPPQYLLFSLLVILSLNAHNLNLFIHLVIITILNFSIYLMEFLTNLMFLEEMTVFLFLYLILFTYFFYWSCK